MAVDLGDIEKRLNEDAELRSQFLKDPVGTMRKEGLILSATMEEKISRFVREIHDPKQNVSGASVGPRDKSMDIGISIGKSF